MKRSWTDADDARLASMWRRHVLLKVIMDELDRTQASVLCRVRRLGLEPRRSHRDARRLMLYVKPELDRAIRRRALERQTNVAGYIRYLIQRDVA